MPYDLIELTCNYNGYTIYIVGYLISDNPDYLEVSNKLVFEADGLASAISESVITERILERKLIRSKSII